jgi:hypothetical protein
MPLIFGNPIEKRARTSLAPTSQMNDLGNAFADARLALACS